MKNQRLLRFLFLTAGIAASLAMVEATAQERVVAVASGNGTLNNTVVGDSIGRISNPNTWYELERNGYYILTAPIANNKYNLQIRTAAGTGAMATIRPGVGSGGAEISRSFDVYAPLTLKGVYLNALVDGGTLKQNNIRVRSDSVRITIDSCHLDRDLTAVLRFDARWGDVYVRRSYFSNLGMMADGNGRGLDDRGNALDTVIIENNVWYNFTGRPIRDDGGLINYLRFDHNTVVNVADRITIGEVKEGYITNNLFVNHFFLGYDTTGRAFIETKPLLSGTHILDIHHNNFYLHPSIVSAFPTTSRGPVHAIPNFDSLAQAFIDLNGHGSTNTALEVTFTDGPLNEVTVMQEYWNTGIPPTSRREMYAGPDSGKGSYGAVQMPFDFRYSTGNPLYSMGTNNTPIGALFVFDLTLGVEPIPRSEIPNTFSLSQNYPNPFNPTTTIEFAIPRQDFVTLSVFNILGKEVSTLVSEQLNAGSYKVKLDGARLASGMYFYRLQAGSSAVTKKLSLIK